ncbi:MAG: DoxX family membrane protein, partial [Tannerella sp.]|nr:DoxX family membrane protein [Tannerella sp.]
MKKNVIIKLSAEFFRILLGVTFVFSGIVKAIDPVGNVYKIKEYLVSFGLDHFLWTDKILSFGQAALEFTLGFCLLLGVYRKLMTISILLVMCFMTPLTLYLAIYNPVADCGCFGDALIITNWQTFYKNIVLLAGSIFLVIYCRRLTSFYTYKTCWFVVLFSFFFCIAFCLRNFDHLPIVDFRPYKVGSNIFKLMEIPEDAPQDVFHFIYEKEGVKKEFTLEDFPDSTWTYVDSKLIKKGFVPKVSSFELYNDEQENIANRILSRPDALFLLIAPTLEEAADEHIEEINNVYDYACEKRYPFYCITGSSQKVIEEWRSKTSADYPFLTADDVMLKTMIRSNPGLVLLKEGTILAKWHHNDIPKENRLAETVAGYLVENPEEMALSDESAGKPVMDAIEEMVTDTIKKNNPKDRVWLRIISGFALPLLLIW